MQSADSVVEDLASLPDNALDDELCQLCSHIYAAEYRLIRAIGEWESRGLCGAYGVKSTAHWLNHKCGIALGAAREKVRVARARSRTVPWRIRRALDRRDGGCRFPGCTERRYVDAHHIHHWADGGETSLGNLVLLCRHHHRLVHEEGFGCRRTDDGAVVFSYPDGRRVPEAFPLKRGAYEDLAELHRRAGLAIGPKTCSGGWDGTPFSLGEAVAQLFDTTHGAGYSPPPKPAGRQVGPPPSVLA